jgi:hypothetical protein
MPALNARLQGSTTGLRALTCGSVCGAIMGYVDAFGLSTYATRGLDAGCCRHFFSVDRRRTARPLPGSRGAERGVPEANVELNDRGVFGALRWLLAAAVRHHRLVTPGTLLRWHRKLIFRPWTFRHRQGWPPIATALADLIERVARLTRQTDPRATAQCRPPGRRLRRTPQTASDTFSAEPDDRLYWRQFLRAQTDREAAEHPLPTPKGSCWSTSLLASSPRRPRSSPTG